MDKNTDLIVYTCSTRGYDYVVQMQRATPGLRFLLFTDDFSQCPAGWELRPLVSPPRLRVGHDINRFHKIFAHHVLPDCRYSVYLDGNIGFHDDMELLVNRLRERNLALGAFKHPSIRTLAEEADACIKVKKFDDYDRDKVTQQLSFYRSEGLDMNQLITANYLLVRDHGFSGLPEAMSLWWSQLFEFSKRDQMSLAYVLWKTELPWAFLDEDLGVDANLLTRHRHTKKSRGYLRKLRLRLSSRTSRN
jgi:hypothetical protein